MKFIIQEGKQIITLRDVYDNGIKIPKGSTGTVVDILYSDNKKTYLVILDDYEGNSPVFSFNEGDIDLLINL